MSWDKTYGADPKNFSCQLEQDLYNSCVDNKSLELELVSTKKMLDEAKEVIKFYADEDNWLGILHKDKIICPDIRIADNGCNNIGGLKARSFLAKHEKKEGYERGNLGRYKRL